MEVSANDERDEALVQRTLEGDKRAFEALVRRYRRAAITCALGVVGDWADAEDVAQDSFFRAYEQLALCREPARFGGWLMMIVRRRALNHRRSVIRRRTAPLLDSIPSEDRGVQHGMEEADTRRVLVAAFQHLTPLQRSVVVFADVEQWAHQRIAEALGISVVMSRRHLSDARRKLREILSRSSA